MFVYRAGAGGWELVSSSLAGTIIDSIAGCQRRPERVFAGVTHDGLYRTDDAGLNWTKVLDGDIRSVAVDATDNVVYAGTEPVNLHRSEDGGDEWEEVTTLFDLPEPVRQGWWSPVSGIGHVRHIFVHPDDPNIIYLGMEHGGVQRSFDRGATWEDVTAGIDYIDMHMVASAPHRFDRYYASSARGFFTAADPAEGWVRAENGFTRDYYHDFAFLPGRAGQADTMLVATADHSPGSWDRPERARAAMFRSDDYAQSWRRIGVGAGLPEELTAMISTILPHPTDPDAAFIGLGELSRGHAHGPGGPGRILLTHDRGESWEDLGIEIPGDRVLWAARE
jgi:photosystem II stability/assembly factor-like uncharacterized protein